MFGEFGIVAAKNGDPRGLATIEVFDLNREELVDDRYRLQQQVIVHLTDAFRKALDDWGKPIGERQPVGSYLDDSIGPSARYSRAVRAYAELRLTGTNLTL